MTERRNDDACDARSLRVSGRLASHAPNSSMVMNGASMMSSLSFSAFSPDEEIKRFVERFFFLDMV